MSDITKQLLKLRSTHPQGEQGRQFAEFQDIYSQMENAGLTCKQEYDLVNLGETINSSHQENTENTNNLSILC